MKPRNHAQKTTKLSHKKSKMNKQQVSAEDTTNEAPEAANPSAKEESK